MIDEYTEAAVQRLLTEHGGLAEQGIKVVRRERVLALCGEVESRQRRDEILRLVHESFPDVPLSIDIGVTRANAPTEAEELP
ncbi:hypothetical protein [Micromonospora sp. CPCC 206061]|uniref:hypothetical protein n=1 Tax=Micromonospora sp. CPCC 206061 TaxID=3122410 RepID=UPI002FF3C418